jgi:hypothetical protein
MSKLKELGETTRTTGDKVKSILMNTLEAADYLNMSTAFLERDRWRGGDIPYIRIGPRAIRYDLEQLDEYIDRNTIKNVSENSK